MNKTVKQWIARTGLDAAKKRSATLLETQRLTPVVEPLLAAIPIEQQANPAQLATIAYALFRRKKKTVDFIKKAPDVEHPLARRMARFADEIQAGFSPFSGADALDILQASNHFLGLADPVSSDAGMDVGAHFRIASSFANKGPMLYNAVRIFRPEALLEVGTAYGMSAGFMLAAAKRYSPSAHLDTIELSEPQFSLAEASLGGRFGQRVRCHKGLSTDAIPNVLAANPRIDLVFHDGAHDGRIYESDFAALLPALTHGAVVIFDDIDWFDKRVVGDDDPGCYQGWRHIVDRPEVLCAAEIDGSVGVALVKG